MILNNCRQLGNCENENHSYLMLVLTDLAAISSDSQLAVCWLLAWVNSRIKQANEVELLIAIVTVCKVC